MQNSGVGCGKRWMASLCYTASEIQSHVAARRMMDKASRTGDRMYQKRSLGQSQNRILRVYAVSTSVAKSCWYFLWIGECPRFAAYTAIHATIAELKSCSRELSALTFVFRVAEREAVFRPCNLKVRGNDSAS